MANKALGPDGPRALLASIPTPLNFQLGNTDTVCQYIAHTHYTDGSMTFVLGTGGCFQVLVNSLFVVLLP